MKNTWNLYKFEIKKILSSRMTIVLLVILLAFAVLEGLNPGSTVTEEITEMQQSLNGRAIDDELLNEMYPLLLDDYGIKWNYQNAPYERIAYLEREIVGYNTSLRDYSADDMYEIRRTDMYTVMEYEGLTKNEIEWWKNREKDVAEPFIYQYDAGALILIRSLSGLTTLLVIVSAMCLSMVFTSEHRFRTDQLVMSCRHGRRKTYIAKTAAGITFALFGATIPPAVSALVIYLRHGLDGFNAIVQMEVPMSGYGLTMGQFIEKQMILMITASILFAVFAMVISEMLKNSIAAVGVMLGVMIVSLAVSIPPKYRLLSQAMSMVPTTQISMDALLGHRLVHIFGNYFTGFDSAPVLYLLLAALLAIVGNIVYNRFQVSGR